MAVTLKAVHGEQGKEKIMQIRLYQDLEEIRPGGIKRFGKKQIITTVISVAVSMPVILLLTLKAGMEAYMAAYIGIVPAFIIAWFGMYQKNGMNYMEYQRVRRQLGVRYEYMTYMMEEEGEEEDHEGKAKGQGTGHKEK